MQNTKTKAIVSLVLGIAGCAAVWFGWGAILSLGLGIAAIILGMQVRKLEDANKGLATGGFVTGIVSVVLGGIMAVCVICAVCAVASMGAAAGLA